MVFVTDQYELNSVWQETVVSSTILTAWIFSLAAGSLTDRFGRKPTILAASVVFAVGALILGVAPDKYFLVAGRLVLGAAIGLSSMAVPVYISEVSPAAVRGKLVTLNNCCITGGQFVAALVAGAFSYVRPDGWRYMLGLAAVPAVVQLVGFLFMPESPRWLVQHGRHEEALAILKKIRATSLEADVEFVAIKSDCDLELKKSRERSRVKSRESPRDRSREMSDELSRDYSPGISLEKSRDLSRESSREHSCERSRERSRDQSILRRIAADRPLLGLLVTGCLLQAVQQLSGINTFMYYSATILEMAGFRDKSLAVWLASTTATVNFLCTFLGLALVERIGRRKLVIGSLAGVVVGLVVLGVGFQVEHGNGQDVSCWLVLVGLLLYLFFFAPGMGPMPWTINSELYPMWARSTCYSITTSVNWAFNFLVSMTFLSLTEAISRHGAFYLYAGIALVGLGYFVLCLPETKGKSLEDLEATRKNVKHLSLQVLRDRDMIFYNSI